MEQKGFLLHYTAACCCIVGSGCQACPLRTVSIATSLSSAVYTQLKTLMIIIIDHDHPLSSLPTL